MIRIPEKIKENTNNESVFIVSNGVENRGKGLPDYMMPFFHLLKKKAPEVYSVPIFERSKSWPQHKLFRETRRVLDIMKYFFLSDRLVKEIMSKVPSRVSRKSFIPVCYSSSFDLWVRAIEQNQYNVPAIVAIDGVMISEKRRVINNPYLKRIINITTNSWLPCSIKRKQFYDFKKKEIKVNNVVIEGSNHYIFDNRHYLDTMVDIILKTARKG